LSTPIVAYFIKIIFDGIIVESRLQLFLGNDVYNQPMPSLRRGDAYQNQEFRFNVAVFPHLFCLFKGCFHLNDN